MIRFNDPVKFWWDVMVLILAIFICYLLPVDLAFKPPFGESIWYKVVEDIIECIFAIDVIVHFDTSIYDEDGNEVFSYPHIAQDYLKETHFWIDMIATIPFGVNYFLLIMISLHLLPKFASALKLLELLP